MTFDTFFSMGGYTSQASEAVLLVGGTGNIPDAPAEFNQGIGGAISAAWAPGAGVAVRDETRYPVAQITLSEDAEGSFFFFSSSTINGSFEAVLEAGINGGVIGNLRDSPSEPCIPEPCAGALLLSVCPTLCRFRGMRAG